MEHKFVGRNTELGDFKLGSTPKLQPYGARGTSTPWYRGWDLTESERDRFRQTSRIAKEAKARALRGDCVLPKHPIPVARLAPLELMPLLPSNNLRALSLFSGCGGLDLGFERAGYTHVASYDILKETSEVLSVARPNWEVFSGAAGDVTKVDWRPYKNKVDVLHGGPPCQPFSHAGNRKGADDVRDMVPEFVRAVLAIVPKAFVMENVSGLATKKFVDYLEAVFFQPLSLKFTIKTFILQAEDFGVPQRRKRIFFVGFHKARYAAKFEAPQKTHSWKQSFGTNLPKTMGTREALGLPQIGYDDIAPTIRSGWTGPRHTTSVVNSATAMKDWNSLQIWPNGVAATRDAAAAFVAKDGHFRLSVPDCMVLQGFPDDWPIKPPVYKALGLIGNSVAPPVGYAVAKAVQDALL